MDVLANSVERSGSTDIAPRPKVICVDLDGTLVRSDTLLESILALLRRRPYLVFVLPFWLLGGRAGFKERIASAIELDVTLLPYNAELVSWLRSQRDAGRILVLASATHATIAEGVARHLKIFSQVFASRGRVNLKAENKAAVLAQAFPDGFAYAGNSAADLPVWKAAASAVLVELPTDVRARLPEALPIECELLNQSSTARGLWRSLRPHQWAKNLLVAVPLLTAHQYGNASAIAATLLAFAAMCLVASAIYLVNDLLDLPADRQHETKRFRPLARGDLSIAAGMIAVPLLLLGAALVCWLLQPEFAIGLGGYVFAAVVYSIFVKHVGWIDTAWLAGLYTLRIAIGALAIGVPVSHWLFAYSAFAFMSLALLKRYEEMGGVIEHSPDARIRGYNVRHRIAVERLGWLCAAMAGVVLMLYLHSDTVQALYRHVQILWIAAGLMTGFLAWMWLAARRGRMHEDPVVFALREPMSYVVLVGLLGCILLAR